MSHASAPPPRPAALPAHGAIPTGTPAEGRYEVRFATTTAELDEALRLRYEIFNLELGEGLEESHRHRLDRDEFDAHCHHLLVIDSSTGAIVGTYRMQTAEMARAGAGFYCDGEYDLSALPDEIVERGIEIGRACIAREHRKNRVLFALWKGLASYLKANDKVFLFGCCSLTSTDPADGVAMLDHLQAKGHTVPGLPVTPRPGFECLVAPDLRKRRISVPPLFAAYLRYRARVFSPPAIDRTFKTIDFLVALDVRDLDAASYELFFEEPGPPPKDPA